MCSTFLLPNTTYTTLTFIVLLGVLFCLEYCSACSACYWVNQPSSYTRCLSLQVDSLMSAADSLLRRELQGIHVDCSVTSRNTSARLTMSQYIPAPTHAARLINIISQTPYIREQAARRLHGPLWMVSRMAPTTSYSRQTLMTLIAR